MIQKHDLPILEYDFDSIEVISPIMAQSSSSFRKNVCLVFWAM